MSVDGEPAEPMRIRLFGTIRVEDGGNVLTISSAAQRRILGRLALAANGVVSQDALVDLLWPDDPPRTAIASVQNQVHRLRSLLGAERIASTAPGYALLIDPIDIDIHRFAIVLSRPTEPKPAHPVEQARVELADLESALALWSGPPLDEFADESWARPTVVRLTEQHVIAQERRIEALLTLRRIDDAVPAAEALCEQEPLRERAHGLLMRGLAQQGRAVEALRVFHKFRERTVRETGLEPSASLSAIERGVLDRSGSDSTEIAVGGDARAGAPGGLPVEVLSLIGRETDIAELRDRLSTGSLVTVTGPGGVGKTRVAVRVAHEMAPMFLDGARFVDLAAVSPDDIGACIASAIGAVVMIGTPIEAAIRLLSGRHLLVVLDCCERVVDAVAAWTSAVTRSCPMVRVLATSRESLQVAGEEVFALEPLGAAAVELFEARACAVRRGFALSPVNQPFVESICRSLDGLPLAIELAAARCDRMTVAEVSAQLGQHFVSLDSGPRTANARHRGLSQVIDWSWDLLSPTERTLLARISVFPDGCTVDAAVQVCGFGELASSEVPALLGSLVRKSLLSADLDGDRARYRLLDTLRAYGSERLGERGEIRSLNRSLAEWAAGVLDETLELLTSPREAEGAARQNTEMANLSAALAWTIEAAETDLAMRCLRPIIVSFRQSDLLPPDWPIDSVPGWREHPDAAYIYLRQAQRAVDPDAARQAAFACTAQEAVPLFVAVWAHSAAVRVLAMWRRDPSDNLAEMRRLAEGSTDPYVRLHAAFGEHFAAGRGSAESMGWISRARNAAIETGVPSIVGMAEYISHAFRVDDDALCELRRLRQHFADLGNTFMAGLCVASLDQARPGSARVADVLATTRNAFRDSPMWLRGMARSRAQFLASHGRTRAAAMLAGALDGSGLQSTWLGETPLVERAVADHPDAFELGRGMSMDVAAGMLIAELESLSSELERSVPPAR